MHTDYTGTTPPSSIEYITNVDDNVPQITATISSQSGNIKGVVVQYAYVLYKQYGAQSNMSPLTKPISLYDDNRGFKPNERTYKSVDLSLSYSSNSFNKIRIYRIAYVRSGQEPEVNIIFDQDYTSPLNYTDTGYNVAELAYSEFVSQYGIDIKPLLIESKENTLFAANVEYEQKEVDDLFQGVTVSYTPYQRQYPDYYISSYGTYTDDDQGGDGYGRSLMPGETYRYGIVFYDTKGRRSSVMYIRDVPISSSYTPFNIRRLISYPHPSSDPSAVYPYLDTVTYEVSKIGIQASVTFANDAQRDNCSGYEIVRCERTIDDSKTITQGIIGTSMKNYGDGSNNRYSAPYMTLQKTKWWCDRDGNNTNTFISANDLFLFASPEIIYDDAECRNFLKEKYKKLSTKLESGYIVPLTPFTSTFYTRNTNGYYINNNYIGDEDSIALGAYFAVDYNDNHYNLLFDTVQDNDYHWITDDDSDICASYVYPTLRDTNFT